MTDPRPSAAVDPVPSAPFSPRRRTVGAAVLGGLGAVALAAPARADGGGKGKDADGGDDGQVEELLTGMSTEQKIGQLFVAFGYGTTVDEVRSENTAATGVGTIAEILRTHQVGGLIYFAWTDNLQDPQQVAELSDAAQRVAEEAGIVPLVISADEERGVVKRLPPPATPLPGAMALGATGSRKHARDAARITATELRACGITQAYAPVADVNVDAANPVIGVRSFGADPSAVAELVGAQVEAFQREDVSAAVKHFPGHGDTATDSHIGLPVIDHTRAELEEIDLPPFRRAIEEGVDVVMTAHIVVPALDDSGVPATLSRPILTGLLREELGFEGVIVTDSLSMEGVRTLFGDDRVPVEAILAGADQMLMPPDLAVAIGGVRDAVASGEITEERLDASVRRILAQKARRGLLADARMDLAAVSGQVGTRRSVRTAARIAEDIVTLLTDDGTLPLRRRSSVLVTGVATQEILDAAVEGLAEGRVEGEPLLLARIDAAAAEQAAAAVSGHDAVVVLTSSSGFTTPAAQVALVAALRETGVPVIHVSVRNPYDVVHVGEVAASIALYSNAASSVRAAGAAIAGRVRTRGTLPVAIPEADGTGEAFPIGHGERVRG